MFASLLANIPWGSVIGFLIKGANYLIDLERGKSEEQAATMAVLNTHMKGALNEIKVAKNAGDAADAAARVDPDSLRDTASPFNSDDHTS
ncbi:MAG TPA: hypothetical protein VGG48_01720 [Rhizomicrobium sp.]|jgi:hypothetical protein